MGCLLCNITNVKEFAQGEQEPWQNFFYCETEEEKKEFLNELISDIVQRHPEVVAQILIFKRKSDRFVQVFDPKNNQWVKIDKYLGEIVSYKRTMTHKGIKLINQFIPLGTLSGEEIPEDIHLPKC